MSEVNDGGPAFPRGPALWENSVRDGMSLRDWFAGMALQAIMQAQIDLSKMTKVNEAVEMKKSSTTAEMAYEIADAMLEARKS